MVSLEDMTVAARTLFPLENSFVRDLEGLYRPWRAATAPAPQVLLVNDELATELGVDPAALESPEGVAVLVGNTVPEGATPVAQAYSGHQFGNYSPRLGDGRALLLGEVRDVHGGLHDLHLKGSGRTPFARGGDGLAPLGPMLREYLMGEAMHALGIPTTRALAVVATGESLVRETRQPGAVLARVASSHLRVGSFQYAAATGDADLLRRLADYAIARHHPAAREADNPYLALLEAVVDVQAELIARWMQVGFVHGVMNTDNMTISGETIDYGPCAFLDVFDPAAVFSSIDHAGRYAYGHQPRVAQWNLARFAEALLPLIDEDSDRAVAAATEVLVSFTERYEAAWSAGMRAKLGLVDESAAGDDTTLVEDLLALMATHHVDHTSFFRSLSTAVRGDPEPARSVVLDLAAIDGWVARWRSALPPRSASADEKADGMDRVNPVYIPRNHLVEEALAAAEAGDLDPFRRFLDVLAHPFEARPGLEAYAQQAPEDFGTYRTFCGT
jgi:uncharacterized protein YdiU (UPF0061 family)